MNLQIKLEAFEGPLDLLLHLIDKNKMNIFDIPIVEITEQYMEYVHSLNTNLISNNGDNKRKDNNENGEGNKNLDLISEFIVMASTLLRIKSQMLLPKEVSKTEEEVDPRAELVERLLEYKMYKYASYELKDRQIDAGKVLFKQNSIPKEIVCMKEEVDLDALLLEITLSKLHAIYEAVIKKREDKIDKVRSKFGQIEKEEVSLSKKLVEIQLYGFQNKKFSFRTFLSNQAEKMEVIVSFLCILELMKLGRAKINQSELFDDIEIEYLADESLVELED